MPFSFHPSYVLPGISQSNYTIKKKRKLHPIYHPTTHPSKSPLPSSSAFSGGLFQVINTNNCPDPEPVTSASPEGRRLIFPNCIWLDTGHVGEEAPEVVRKKFGPGRSEKLRPASLVCYYLALKMFTSFRSIASIWMTSVFWIIYFCLICYGPWCSL